MKKHHLFAYYCTLLVPVGALIGAGIGSEIGYQVLATLSGAGLGVCAALLMVRSSEAGEA